jgi:hypothetical protein
LKDIAMNILGRPRALDEIKKREVCALLAAGGTMRFAGDYVGCSVKTIRNEADRDPEFGRDIHEAQLSAQLEPLRALRRKATTHWRAAAWLLERSRPEHFARLGQKFFKPQDVADLLENIRATLKAHLKDLYSEMIASEVISRVMAEAGLPKGRGCTFAKLSELPVGLAADLSDPFPGRTFTEEELAQAVKELDEQALAKPKSANLFAEFQNRITEKLSAAATTPAKERANYFPNDGTPPDEKKLVKERNAESGGRNAKPS